MQTLRIRQDLHDINGDVPRIDDLLAREDAAYAFTKGRASARLTADDITLPDRPFMHLGTPGEAARDAEAKRERLYATAFNIGIALILALLALTWLQGRHDSPPHRVDTGIAYKERAARLVADTAIYVNDPHEGCLIGMHKDATGQVVVNTHC